MKLKLCMLVALHMPLVNIHAMPTACVDIHSPYARMIALREGFLARKKTLPQRIHNPGALVWTHQSHAKKHPSGFAMFDSDAYGWIALERDLAYKRAHSIPLSTAWEYMK